MAEHVWLLGLMIVSLIAVQAIGATWSLARRRSNQAAQRARSARLLEQRLEASRTRHRGEPRKSLSWAGWRKFEVRRKALEDRDRNVCSFYLAPHDGKSIPSFEPGQFLTFQLKIAGRPKSVVRCYSLSDSPRTDHYRVTIKRVPAPREAACPPGVSSNFFHDAIQQGDILDIKAPAGKFVLDPSGETPIVLVGGGVGITPVLAMLNAAVASGRQQEIWFFYGVRHGGEHIMKDHLQAVARDHPNVHLQVCYSNPGDGDTVNQDYDHAGRVSVALFKKLLPSNHYDFLICGPPPMMDSMIEDLKDWGVPDDRVHFERFGPGPPKRPPVKPVGDEVGTKFEITFKRSGKSATWTSAIGSILDLARACDVPIDSGCERGDCGTCQTAIRTGSVTYTDPPSFECEAGTCLVCCSVPQGPLVLDA